MDRIATMETFVRVVEAGSFSEGAKLLRVGQPAGSKTIAHRPRVEQDSYQCGPSRAPGVLTRS